MRGISLELNDVSLNTINYLILTSTHVYARRSHLFKKYIFVFNDAYVISDVLYLFFL